MITLDGTNGITNDGGYTGDGVVFANATPANTLVTTTGGNVGIGTSSPGTKLAVAGAGTFKVDGPGSTTPLVLRNNDTASTQVVKLAFDSNGAIKASINAAVYGNDYMTFNVGSDTERARIDSSGNFLVGMTSASVSGATTKIGLTMTGGVNFGFSIVNSNSSTATAINFCTTAGGQVGAINYTTTAVSYNTTSDYRLKENIAPMSGALTAVAALKPVTYKWKSTGEATQGFIAHELQEVVPECVTGEKDAVDADGNPKYQGIDTSFLVATLTAAIQELKAIVDAQGAEIAALKGIQP